MGSMSVVRDGVGIVHMGIPLLITCLSSATWAVRSTWVTRWHRIYLDGSSDGFRDLLPDMSEWNLGP